MTTLTPPPTDPATDPAPEALTILDPELTAPFPNSEKVYLSGTLHAGVRVPARRIRQSPTLERVGDLTRKIGRAHV